VFVIFVAFFLLYIRLWFLSGAVIQLANSTANNTFGEGEMVNVCAELVNNGGGLGIPISFSILLLSGTATCMCVMQLIYHSLERSSST
jgi:TRAP-type mannitol/chloroaromatic compound transport system permease small subunit